MGNQTNKQKLLAISLDTYAYYIRKSLYSGQKFSQVAFLSTAKIFTNKINAAEQDKIQETIRSAQAESAKLEQAIQKRAVGLRKLEDEKVGLDNEIKACRDKTDHRQKLESRVKAMKNQAAAMEKDKIDVAALQARSLTESLVRDSRHRNTK